MPRDTPQLSADHIAHRDRVLSQAVRDGKITDGHLEQYRQMFDRDPVGTQQLVARLASRGENQYAAPADSRVRSADRPVTPVMTTTEALAAMASTAASADVDHTASKPKRTAANLGADDSVLRASQQRQAATQRGENLVPTEGGGYVTAEQAAKMQQERELIESYDATPDVSPRPTGRINPANG